MSTKRSMLLSAIGLAAATSGRAEAQVEAIALEYAAPEQCPPRASFVHELEARSNRFSIASSGQRRLLVSIDANGAGYSGKLRISDGSQPAEERRIDGRSCSELVSALALITALALDPDASTDAAPVPSRSPSQPNAYTPRPASIATAPPRAARAAPQQPPTPAPSSATSDYFVGVALGGLRGAAPETLATLAAFVSVERNGAPWRPAFRLSLFGAETGTFGPRADSADYRLFATRSELCPHRVELLARVELWSCVSFEIGQRHVRGRGVVVNESANRLWAASGMALSLLLQPRPGVSLGLGVAENLNLTRDDFVFLDPRRSLFKTPLSSQSAWLMAGFRFL